MSLLASLARKPFEKVQLFSLPNARTVAEVLATKSISFRLLFDRKLTRPNGPRTVREDLIKPKDIIGAILASNWITATSTVNRSGSECASEVESQFASICIRLSFDSVRNHNEAAARAFLAPKINSSAALGAKTVSIT